MPTNELRAHWDLDPELRFLNHGSFGACPRAVLEVQRELRARMERNPVQFFQRDLEPLLDAARARLAPVLGARPQDLAFVTNATSGVNAALAAVPLGPGDELLITNHGYNACNNAARAAVARTGATLAIAQLPFPTASSDELLAALQAAVTPRTRLALVDHITSETALRLPVERFGPWLAERGVPLLVDGAHAPGQIPLALGDMRASFVTGNAHKWLCAPKGAAYLWVDEAWQDRVRPQVVSHAANSTRADRSGFLQAFDWPGTRDPTAWLSIPAALDFLEGLRPGGLDAHMRCNHELALAMRDELCAALRIAPPAPDELLGAMAAVPLPPDPLPSTRTALQPDRLQQAVYARCRVEAPVMNWPRHPARVIRVSAQAYTTLDDARALAAALTDLLAEETR